MHIALSSGREGAHPGPSGHPSEEGNRPHPLPGGVPRSGGVGYLRPSGLRTAGERRFLGMDITRWGRGLGRGVILRQAP